MAWSFFEEFCVMAWSFLETIVYCGLVLFWTVDKHMNTKTKVDDRVNRLVLIIGTDVLPRRELIAALELRQSARRNFRDNYLKPATAKGLVKMQFPEVPSRPEQAYKLTPKGLELLATLTAEEAIWY